MPPEMLSETRLQESLVSSKSESTPKIQRQALLGVGFHCLNMSEALDRMDMYIRERTPQQVCLVNAYTVSIAQKDPELLHLLDKAALVLADGMSIVWGARWVRLRIPGRIAGPDLMTKLCSMAAHKGYRVFLMGSTNENLMNLERTLRKMWPSIQIAGTYSPTFAVRHSEPENLEMINTIAKARPDILFVSMSAPKQEKWIAENLRRLPAPLCIGVGAAFDFMSGRVPRAPAFFQEAGLEWLYRLWCEPRRLWKRYLLGNAVFLSLLARQYFKQLFSSTHSPIS